MVFDVVHGDCVSKDQEWVEVLLDDFYAAIRDEYCIEVVKPDFNPLLVLGYAVAMDHVEHQDRGGVSKGARVITKLLGH